MLENNFYNESEYLNIANFCTQTKVLGPGLRSVIWVQGCLFNCPKCYSPEWIPQIEALSYTPAILVKTLQPFDHIDGVTISGGEPMLQAKKLIHFIKILKVLKKDLNFILYTGYKKEKIDLLSEEDSRRKILNEIDVLIDGVYINALNNNKGLRGSVNQSVWHLTDRLRDYDFTNNPRSGEIKIKNGVIHFVGVPDKRIEQFQKELEKNYVRP